MNRIITILVTIFILLLLYIWISHVWGSDNPRHPRQIVDARESEILGADDSSSDLDTAQLTDAEMENDPIEQGDSRHSLGDVSGAREPVAVVLRRAERDVRVCEEAAALA